MLRRISLLLVLLLVAVACSTGSDAPTTTDSTVPSETTTTAVEATTTTGGASPTTSVPTNVTSTEPDLSYLEGLPDDVIAQLEDLVRVAQDIRGLPFTEPPKITVVSEDELEARVREDIEEESEDLPADEALYKMLGLLADSADFENLVLDLYGEQVAGFYDGDTGEIVVPTRQDGFSLIQQGTLVHELVHALTDQHFSFNPRFQAMIDEERLDEATAYQALIEGDATLAEVLWVQTLSQRELGEFIAASLDVDSASLEAAPRFLRESLLFPYDTGLGFVQSLYVADSGWGGVNDAYTTLAELPGSSEQVITPDDYTRDLPVEVAIPDVDVAGYELERTSVWGEEGFRVMLNQGSTEATMVTAADGWGGDSYHQWFDGENAAMLIVFAGDTPTDVDELEDALLTFAQESFPEDHFAWVTQRDENLYFIAADEPAVGEQIRSAVGLG
ncbi:MAG: hypothetical protein WAL25_06430 [Acidimicrobiia bacterium]